jgi:O-antigen/teichoic acid export membrane protein
MLPRLSVDTNRAFQLFQVLRQLAIIVIAIALARSGLSQQAIGNYELLFFLLYTVSFFWISGCAQALLTRYTQLPDSDRSRLLFQVFLFSTALSVGIIGLLYWQQETVLNLLVQQPSLAHYQLFLVYMLFSLPTYLVEYIYLLQNKRNALVVFALFSFLGQIVAVLLPLLLGYDFQWSFVALIGVGIVKYSWLVGVIASTIHWNIKWNLLSSLLLTALPLILYALLGGAAQLVDAYLVNWYYEGDTAQFAIFRYGARELPFALAIAVAFSSSWLPKLGTVNTDKLQVFRQRSKELYHLLFPLAIVAAWSSSYLFTQILGEDFAASYLVFNTYLLIIPSRLLFPHTLLIAQERNHWMVYISIVELLINMSVSLLLIGKYGMLGIAWGTVVAYLFEKIAYIVILATKQNIYLATYTAIGWWLVYSTVLGVVVIWSLL